MPWSGRGAIACSLLLLNYLACASAAQAQAAPTAPTHIKVDLTIQSKPTNPQPCGSAVISVKATPKDAPKGFNPDFTGQVVTVTDYVDASTQAIPDHTIALNADGSGSLTISSWPPGTHKLYATFLTSSANHGRLTLFEDRPPAPVTVVVAPPLDSPCLYPMPPLVLTLVGLDVEAASSTSPAATFLGDVSVDLPLRPQTSYSGRLTDIQNARVFMGGSLRIAGIAQPGSVSASALTSGYLSKVSNSSPDQIVQSWEGTGSLSIRLFHSNLGVGTIDAGEAPPSFPRNTLLTTSLVISAGFDSPLSASQANPPVFYATTQIQNAYPHEKWSGCSYTTTNPPPCYVAFIPADRNHFYRHYEAGLRFRLYGEDFDHHMLRFPGIFDLTAGQNEYVTAGKLHGWVVHIGGVMPFAIPHMDGIYAFGALDSDVTGGESGGAQLLLEPVSSSANINYLSDGVYDITVPQPDRDRYRFGFGIDLYHLLTMPPKKNSNH